ncbi:hypothetical protein EDB19DRAFT_1959964 [Suillus lakei]|nr:hypothetical protein EDB19DRAFT_1959964 [Suillus lakei]
MISSSPFIAHDQEGIPVPTFNLSSLALSLTGNRISVWEGILEIHILHDLTWSAAAMLELSSKIPVGAILWEPSSWLEITQGREFLSCAKHIIVSSIGGNADKVPSNLMNDYKGYKQSACSTRIRRSQTQSRCGLVCRDIPNTGHHRRSDSLERDHEPELTGAEEIFGPLDDAGLVVSEFSDGEDDDGFADEW